MRIFKSNRKEHNKAQTMVEFALVLPILLLIIYGLLEVGRLIFIYSTVVSASREAARYGSATGLNQDGTKMRYNDCAGIQAAAYNVDFLRVINIIVIQYDHGPKTLPPEGPIPGYPPPFSSCPPGSIQTGDRIVVQVSATFTPLAAIVPLNPITITSSNARTVIGSVQILP